MDTPEDNHNLRQELLIPEKEKTIESYRTERLSLWSSMMTKMKEHPQVARFLSAAVNATAGSYIKLTAETIAGKTIDQQKLTPLGRIMNVFIVGSGLASYGLAAAHRFDLAAISYTSSWAGYALMYGPDILSPVLREVADKLGPSHRNIANIFSITAQVAEQPKKLFFRNNP